jgi:hypothetical protein
MCSIALPASEPIEVGLFLNSYRVPAWVYTSIENMLKRNAANLRLVVFNENSPKGDGRHNRGKANFSLSYRMYNRVDMLLFGRPLNPFRSMDVSSLVQSAEVIRIEPETVRGCDTFKKSDIERIRSFRLDALLQFGFNRLTGDILNSALYGVWAFKHSISPAGFWEVAEARAITEAALYKVQESSGGAVLEKCAVATHQISPYRTRNMLYWASTTLITEHIARMKSRGEELAKMASHNIPRVLDDDLQAGPRIKELLPFLWRLSKRAFDFLLKRWAYLQGWSLLYDHQDNANGNPDCFEKLIPPKDRFYADPHVVEHLGRFYVFIEEYVFKKKKGHISVLEIDAGGNCTVPVCILEEPHHLSFPSIVRNGEHYYMIPESSAGKGIDLYVCTEFPIRWEFKMRLFDKLCAVDTSVIFHKDKWWLFTGIAAHEESLPNVKLFVFFADEFPTRAWTPHPLNPVVSDIDRTRLAGSVFVSNGIMYRPSQTCSKGYGYSFNLNEVQVLTETDYMEREVRSVNPTWDPRVSGTHTIAQEGPLTVLDALYWRPKFL